MTESRLVDLDRVLSELRRYEASEILQAGHRGPAGFLSRLYDSDPSTLIGARAAAAMAEDRLATAAAQALERLEVAENDAGGAVDEARAILAGVVHLDGTGKHQSCYVHPNEIHDRRLGPEDWEVVVVQPSDPEAASVMRDQDIQRQLGVCPNCGHNDTVVNTRADVYECITTRTLGIRGCGATWRGARLGVPK